MLSKNERDKLETQIKKARRLSSCVDNLTRQRLEALIVG
jgi:hypothetical protein